MLLKPFNTTILSIQKSNQYSTNIKRVPADYQLPINEKESYLALLFSKSFG